MRSISRYPPPLFFFKILLSKASQTKTKKLLLVNCIVIIAKGICRVEFAVICGVFQKIVLV